MQKNTFVSLPPDLGCAITVQAKGEAGDLRRSWAAHTGLRLCSNSSITGVTLERSNLEREKERRAEGDKQKDRGSVSAGQPPTPRPPPPEVEAVAWMIPHI